MITADIHATDLADFYAQIVAAQTQAHGDGYCAHHDVIRRHGAADMVYAELGVNQGGTLACAVLAGYGTVIGVDHRYGQWAPFEGLFRVAAQGRILSFYEQDTRVPIGAVDFLLIDSMHTVEHLRAELCAHAANVREYILAHDTTAHPELHAELEQLDVFRVIERETRNVGYTLLRRYW